MSSVVSSLSSVGSKGWEKALRPGQLLDTAKEMVRDPGSTEFVQAGLTGQSQHLFRESLSDVKEELKGERAAEVVREEKRKERSRKRKANESRKNALRARQSRTGRRASIATSPLGDTGSTPARRASLGS